MISKFATDCRERRLGKAIAELLISKQADAELDSIRREQDPYKLLGTAASENATSELNEGLKNPVNALQALTGASLVGGSSLGYGAAHLLGAGPVGKTLSTVGGGALGAGASMILARAMAERERRSHAINRDAAVDRINELSGAPKAVR